KQTAIVAVGVPAAQDFEKGLSSQLNDHKVFVITGKETKAELGDLLKEIRGHRQIVMAVHDNRLRPSSTSNLSEDARTFVSKLAGRRTITVMFTNPYALDDLEIERSSAVILGYQNDSFMQKAALKVVLGQLRASGKLPVNINKRFQNG